MRAVARVVPPELAHAIRVVGRGGVDSAAGVEEEEGVDEQGEEEQEGNEEEPVCAGCFSSGGGICPVDARSAWFTFGGWRCGGVGAIDGVVLGGEAAV